MALVKSFLEAAAERVHLRSLGSGRAKSEV